MKTNYLRLFMNVLQKGIEPIQIICLYCMVGLMFLTVFLREVFGIGLSWGYEITAFFAILLVYLGMPINEKEKGHLKMGFLYEKLQGYPKKIMDALHFFITAFTVALMGKSFIAYIDKLGNYKMSASRWPNWFFYGIIGVGVALTLLELLSEIIDFLFVKKKAKGSEKVDEISEEGSVKL